jgi:hypothetical protein
MELANGQTKASFLDFIAQYRTLDAEVAEVVGVRKELRARIKAAGLSLGAFDRARKLADMAQDKRDAEHREVLRNLEWLSKPIGHQAVMEFLVPHRI